MRGVLEALGRCARLNTRELTAEVQGGHWSRSDEVSTRRALRRLHAQRRVYCLGYDAHGARVWCLPEYAGILTPPWAVKRDALTPPEGGTLGELLGSRYRASMARAWLTSGLTREG